MNCMVNMVGGHLNAKVAISYLKLATNLSDQSIAIKRLFLCYK